MICSARADLDLASQEKRRVDRSEKDVTHYVSVMADRPRELPPLPIMQPANQDWQVKVIGVTGRFAVSLHRRRGRTFVYPTK